METENHKVSASMWGLPIENIDFLIATGLNFNFFPLNYISLGYPYLQTCCQWTHGLRPKELLVTVAVPPAPVRVPSQRPLAPSVASVMSVANDKGDNEMILGAVHPVREFKYQYKRTNLPSQ